MKRLIITIGLIASLPIAIYPQTKSDLEYAKRLKGEFIKATQGYKASLEKLAGVYEQEIKRAEEKVTVSEKLLHEGLIARSQVLENKEALQGAKDKLAETRRQQENANKEITSLPSDEEMAKEFARSRQRARKSTRCGSWDLVARQRTTAKSVTVSYTFTCR